MMKWARFDLKNKNEKINRIKENAKKYKIINSNDLDEI